ncbi:MAG: hypothetical protein ACE5EN_00075 [Nitrospinota bacterium]
MKVTIMPEYESQGVLVTQEGKFVDRNSFPGYVQFNLPKEVKALTDACSLSPKGQHFCQIYDIKHDGDKKWVDIGLPYPDFFVDYKYAPFKVKEQSKREFTYSVKSEYNVNTLEVHIQKPYRAEDFSIIPAGLNVYEKRDFEYAKYVFKNVKAGEIKNFTIAYFKADSQPSVDIKYRGRMQMGVFGDNSGGLLLGAGILLLGVIVYVRRRKSGTAKS